MDNRLSKIGHLQRRGISAGIYAVCSSNSLVIETALENADRNNPSLIIESTCNQVNQYGGYTGMTPADFTAYIKKTAEKTGFPQNSLVIGGDHLGPYPWRHESAASAMSKAEKLVCDYVTAGYGKIHLDCGMPLADDKTEETRLHHLSPELSAKRTIALCKSAEAARSNLQRKQGLPLYVIGAESPSPGGSTTGRVAAPVTRLKELSGFIEICKRLFNQADLEDAWDRVAAIVVQPGIDFGTDSFVPYNKAHAKALSSFHSELPGKMTFEVHSTDFQPEALLSEMVTDHFALLKTGPALTFALREAVFALAHIENELLKKVKGSLLSNIINVIDREMITSPKYWRTHIPDNEAAHIHRIYGFTDRVRYYWHYPAVKKALALLLLNLDRTIPLTLISQYLPQSLSDVINEKIPAEPVSLMKHRISQALSPYLQACETPP
jgi:D-tagatose-1,6-bisphosphate aldolase subunit GatZ/KbaZ